MSPEIYRKAADLRQAQLKNLPSYLKRTLPKSYNQAPDELRKHADYIEAEENNLREIKQKEHEEYINSLTNEIKTNISSNDTTDTIFFYLVFDLVTILSKKYKNIYASEDINRIKEKICDSIQDLEISKLYSALNDSDYSNEFYDYFPDKEDYDIIEASKQLFIDKIRNMNEETLYSCVYSFENKPELIIASDKFWNALGETESSGCFIEGDTKDYVFILQNDLNGQAYPLRKTKMKYILTGDFRGNYDEVSDYAYYSDFSGKVAFIPYLADGVLISNSKKLLEQIGQELWDEHIAQEYYVRPIR